MAGDSSVQLLHSATSPFVLRVELALAFKQVEYEKVPQDRGTKSPLLMASNSIYKKIPVLIHKGKAVCESSIIVQYVDETWPSPHQGIPNLLPSDPCDKAVARFWADFVDKKVFDALYSILITKKEDQKVAVENIIAIMATLEEALENVTKEPPFFGGSTIGFVDIMLGPIISWLPVCEELCNFTFPFEKYPHLHGWFLALKDHPIGSILPEPQKIKNYISEFVL